MQKIKATIYIPIGIHNASSNNEDLVVKQVRKQIPSKLKVDSITDVYVDEYYSACTVELEELSQEVGQKNVENNSKDEYNEVLKFIDSKIKNVKNSKNKNDLEDIKKFIHELQNKDSKY